MRSATRFLALCALAAAGPVAAQNPFQYRTEVAKYLMGTRVEATVVHHSLAETQQGLMAAFQEMGRVEALLSTHLGSSEISLVNRSAAAGSVVVSEETFSILSRAAAYSKRLGGLFDITASAAALLWGFGPDHVSQRPDSTAVEHALKLMGLGSLRLEPDTRGVALAHAGSRIDLGAIAKGYAVDQAAKVLRHAGITNFLINAGGDVLASGRPEPGRIWKVGIRHPRDPSQLIATIQVEDGAVATSGDYERWVEYDGVRFPHIVDPRTGRPSMANQSASALAKTAEEADVLATYLFVAGRLDEETPHLVMDKSGKVRTATPRFDLVPSRF